MRALDRNQGYINTEKVEMEEVDAFLDPGT